MTSPLKSEEEEEEEEERDTVISAVPALTLMAARVGFLPAGSVSAGLDFFSPLCCNRGRKNQYLGAEHDRGIISELKWLSGIVIW